MKTIVTIIMLIIYSCYQLSAQGISRKMNVFAQGGVTDNGYNVALGFERMFGVNENNGLDIDLNYHNVDNSAASIPIIVNEKSYFASISYKRYFMLNNLSPIFPYLGVGFLGGYQYLSGATSGIYSFSPETNFIYGGKSFAGIEYRLSKVALFLEGSYLFTGDHYLRGNIGVRYNL